MLDPSFDALCKLHHRLSAEEKGAPDGPREVSSLHVKATPEPVDQRAGIGAPRGRRKICKRRESRVVGERRKQLERALRVARAAEEGRSCVVVERVEVVAAVAVEVGDAERRDVVALDGHLKGKELRFFDRTWFFRIAWTRAEEIATAHCEQKQ